MITLAIDASSYLPSAALLDGRDIIKQEVSQVELRGNESLLLLVEEVLADSLASGVVISQIAVTVGPGSFTGVRNGLATAQGLCWGWGVPLYGVPLLLAGANLVSQWKNIGASCLSGSVVVPYVEANQLEYFAGIYRFVEGHRNSAPGVSYPEEIVPCTVIKKPDLGSWLQEQIDSSSSLMLPIEAALNDLSLTRAALVGQVAGSNLAKHPLVRKFAPGDYPSLEQESAETKRVEAFSSLNPFYGKGVNARTIAERLRGMFPKL